MKIFPGCGGNVGMLGIDVRESVGSVFWYYFEIAEGRQGVWRSFEACFYDEVK